MSVTAVMTVSISPRSTSCPQLLHADFALLWPSHVYLVNGVPRHNERPCTWQDHETIADCGRDTGQGARGHVRPDALLVDPFDRVD